MPIKNDPVYLDLQKTDLPIPDGVDIALLERLAKVVRGFLFAAVESGQSGHPGSSSKVEEILSLVLGLPLAYNPINPKHPGRDRLIWSAGHCTPALFGINALIYECLRRVGRQFSEAVVHPIFPEDLVAFRHVDGPQGHAEATHPLSDYSTGPSGHGLSAAGGIAMVHKSCGLATKVWVMMGDAESEEGMTYEARNILATTGTDNVIVTLDYNHFGIDGPIEEVISTPYINHWLGLGWNVIEVDGHSFVQLITAYRTAQNGFDNKKPTVILAHTLKGKSYGNRENTALSHGSPIPHDEYVAVMKNLGFDIPGKKGEAGADIETVLMTITPEEEMYVAKKLEEGAEKILAEQKLVEVMKKTLGDRSLVNPISIRRPKTLPPELVFKPGTKIATRKAAGVFFEWLMKQTAFVYTGAGDVGGSVCTSPAEKIYGIYNTNNPTGRGFRFGIAEQNMAMMSVGLTSDVLPGGYQPISIFGTFAVFTTMIGNCLRLATINNQQNPNQKGFFITIASHDGPETGEDGPTHQGLYWMSLYQALPGIKVYKPLDANDTIEMLFGALEKNEPIILSLARTENTIFEHEASESTNGAYILKPYSENGNKKIVLAVSGGMLMENILSAVPKLEEKLDIKIVGVTSPELFMEYVKTNSKKADKIISADEVNSVITLHNGWKGFLNDFLLPEDTSERSIGIDTYLKSGTASELYELAKLDTKNLIKKIFQVTK